MQTASRTDTADAESPHCPACNSRRRISTHQCSIHTDPRSPCPRQVIYSQSMLRVMDLVPRPLWVFDMACKDMWWANSAACQFWSADSLHDLLLRDFASDMSQSTHSNFMAVIERFRQEPHHVHTVSWTFHPNFGRDGPKTCDLVCTGIRVTHPATKRRSPQTYVETEEVRQNGHLCLFVVVDRIQNIETEIQEAAAASAPTSSKSAIVTYQPVETESIVSGEGEPSHATISSQRTTTSEAEWNIRRMETLRHLPVAARQFDATTGMLLDQNPEANGIFGVDNNNSDGNDRDETLEKSDGSSTLHDSDSDDGRDLSQQQQQQQPRSSVTSVDAAYSSYDNHTPVNTNDHRVRSNVADDIHRQSNGRQTPLPSHHSVSRPASTTSEHGQAAQQSPPKTVDDRSDTFISPTHSQQNFSLQSSSDTNGLESKSILRETEATIDLDLSHRRKRRQRPPTRRHSFLQELRHRASATSRATTTLDAARTSLREISRSDGRPTVSRPSRLAVPQGQPMVRHGSSPPVMVSDSPHVTASPPGLGARRSGGPGDRMAAIDDATAAQSHSDRHSQSEEPAIAPTIPSHGDHLRSPSRHRSETDGTSDVSAAASCQSGTDRSGSQQSPERRKNGILSQTRPSSTTTTSTLTESRRRTDDCIVSPLSLSESVTKHLSSRYPKMKRGAMATDNDSSSHSLNWLESQSLTIDLGQPTETTAGQTHNHHHFERRPQQRLSHSAHYRTQHLNGSGDDWLLDSFHDRLAVDNRIAHRGLKNLPKQHRSSGDLASALLQRSHRERIRTKPNSLMQMHIPKEIETVKRDMRRSASRRETVLGSSEHTIQHQNTSSRRLYNRRRLLSSLSRNSSENHTDNDHDDFAGEDMSSAVDSWTDRSISSHQTGRNSVELRTSVQARQSDGVGGLDVTTAGTKSASMLSSKSLRTSILSARARAERDAFSLANDEYRQRQQIGKSQEGDRSKRATDEPSDPLIQQAGPETHFSAQALPPSPSALSLSPDPEDKPRVRNIVERTGRGNGFGKVNRRTVGFGSSEQGVDGEPLMAERATGSNANHVSSTEQQPRTRVFQPSTTRLSSRSSVRRSITITSEDLDRCDFVRQFVDREEGRKVLSEVSSNFGHDVSIETQLMTRTQEARWFSVKVRTIRDPITSRPVLIFSARDISSIMQAAKEEADRQNIQKSEFFAVMAHEIRTPLHQVIGFIELLASTSLDAEQTDFVDMLQSSTHALMAIINDLLDFTKLEAGKMKLECIPFEVRSVLQGSVAVVLPQAEEKGLKLEFLMNVQDRPTATAESSQAVICSNGIAIDSGSFKSQALPCGRIPVRVRGDPNRLRQIILNMLTNAIKFTSRGHIRVTATRVVRQVSNDAVDQKDVPVMTANAPSAAEEDDNGAAMKAMAHEEVDCQSNSNDTVTTKSTANEVYIRFTVEDTGVGMTPEQCERIFNAYQQADSSVARQFGGTGLGLAICKSLVEAMDGDIGVSSQTGVGTVFWFEVPFEKHSSRSASSRVDSGLFGPVGDGSVDRHSSKDGHETASLQPSTVGMVSETKGDDAVEPSDDRAPIGDTACNDYRTDDGRSKTGSTSVDVGSDCKIRGGVATMDRAGTSSQNGGGARDCKESNSSADDSETVTRLHVLVAEDNKINQKVIVNMLKRLGHTTTIVENGELAVDKVCGSRRDTSDQADVATMSLPGSDVPYHIVLMDWQMPVMDGIDATKEIRHRGYTESVVPIVGLTASIQNIDWKNIGMNDCLKKPVRISDLKQCLAKNALQAKSGAASAADPVTVGSTE